MNPALAASPCPPANEEIGAVGREIGSRRGIGWQVFRKNNNSNPTCSTDPVEDHTHVGAGGFIHRKKWPKFFIIFFSVISVTHKIRAHTQVFVHRVALIPLPISICFLTT
jgi:hypothetical protein